MIAPRFASGYVMFQSVVSPVCAKPHLICNTCGGIYRPPARKADKKGLAQTGTTPIFVGTKSGATT